MPDLADATTIALDSLLEDDEEMPIVEEVPADDASDETVQVSDEDETGSDDGSYEEDKGPPRLYTEADLHTLTLRFAVGDEVQCNLGGRSAAGTVVQRCYREAEWPRGYYAAYQVQLHHEEPDGKSLIYAPRDCDSYIRRTCTTPKGKISIQVDRRLSQERQLIRKLEASLDASSSNAKKQALYDKLRHRHRESMQHVIADMNRHATAA